MVYWIVSEAETPLKQGIVVDYQGFIGFTPDFGKIDGAKTAKKKVIFSKCP